MRHRPSLVSAAMAAVLASGAGAATASCASERPFGIALADGAADPVIQDLASRAAAGDKHAQLELGIRFEEGRGVSRDLRRAEALYRRASRSGGGTVLVYNPPPAPGQAGFVQRLDHGPERPGLPEARERLARLRGGASHSRHTSGPNPHPEHQP